MAANPRLNQRYQNILWATIQHYVATAEPVGSNTLVQEYDFQVSSATVRNVMGKLEKAGFLYQPHPSAGRIPSDVGYRFYVDHLARPHSEKQSYFQTLHQELHPQHQVKTLGFEVILQGITQLLANLSGYIALATFPSNQKTYLYHLQLVPISDQQIMVIVVTDTFQTQSMVLDVPQRSPETDTEGYWEGQLQIFSNFLNEKLKGKALSSIGQLDWSDLNQEFCHYAEFLELVVRHLPQLGNYFCTTPILVKGIAEAIRQPEFSQVQKVQTLLHLLEVEPEQLVPLIAEPASPQKTQVNIKIGSENPLESMQICALVSASYGQDQEPLGSVGIIGPTRMLYDNAIALVASAADYISATLGDSGN